MSRAKLADMSIGTGRTSRNRTLARELTKLREAAGLTQAEAAQALGWERLKVVRIENTKKVPTVADVSQIISAYGPERQDVSLELVEITRHVQERGWWVRYDGIIDGSYAELEDDADRILSFQTQLLPGLIQDSSYALELIRGFTGDPAEQKRRLDVRMLRHAVLEREKPPLLDFVLTEEVLDRHVGGPEVMRAQLGRLVDLYENPNISVRVIAKRRGAYPLMGQGSIVIFEFDSPVDLNTAYVETLAGGYYVEEADKVKACADGFRTVADVALDRGESRTLIEAKIGKI